MNDDYTWEWKQGSGQHIWLLDTSGRLASERRVRGNSSRAIGFIEPRAAGWRVSTWPACHAIATLPPTMHRAELQDTAKLILLSLKEST